MKNRLVLILLALLMLLSLSACGEPPVYEVRFELNGGTLVSGQLVQHVEEGDAAVPPVIERAGYAFAGWNNAIDAVRENLIVVPLWTAQDAPAPVYEVRFELNGGLYVSGELLQQVASGGAAVPPVIERAGYDFAGWSTDIENVTRDLVVVPLWTAQDAPAPVYEVRFELNGGLYVSGELLQQVASGDAAVPPVIERAGYDFAGWNTDIESVTRDLVVVPLWTAREAPTPVYEVRFELNGGTLLSGELLQRVEQGAAAVPPVVERAGYDFEGWDRDTSAIYSSTVVAARWSQSFRIEFDPAGGELLSGALEQRVPRGALPEAPELALEYYSFAGWEPALREATADARYTALWTARKLSSEEVYRKVAPAVVEIEAALWDGESVNLGSGFFLDDSGRLVTNYHVIDGAVSAAIRTRDGTSHAIAAVVDYSRELDLAILQADVTDTPWLRLSERGVSTGETVYTLGSSEGLTSTFSSGLVSTAERMIDELRCIQITAPISAGNSGGPLLNVYGEVVGVNTMTYISGQNLNFAINAEELAALRRSGSLSLEEVFALEYPEGYGAEEELFYQLADYAENESNDSYEVSDILRNGAWLAGTVSSKADLDWFCFALDAPGEVSFLVAPYFTDDMDYFAVGLLRLKGQDTEILDVLVPTEQDGVPLLSAKVKFEKPGIYFLLVCLSDDYPYDVGANYIMRADW